MAMTLANGMNFVSYGLPGAPEIAGMEVCKAGKTRFRLPNKGRFLKGCAQPWKFELISLKALGYMLADPIPFWRDYYYLDLDPPVEVHQDAPGNHSLVACA